MGIIGYTSDSDHSPLHKASLGPQACSGQPGGRWNLWGSLGKSRWWLWWNWFYWIDMVDVVTVSYIRLIPIIVIYHIILRLVFNPWIPLKGPYAGGGCTVKLAGCPNDCSLHGVLAFFRVRWVHWVKIKQYVNVWDVIIKNVRRSRMYEILTIKNSDFTCFFQQKGAWRLKE